MGDSLEENFALGDDYSDDARSETSVEYEFGITSNGASASSSDSQTVSPVKSSSTHPKPSKKRNWRESTAASPLDAEGQSQLIRETLNFKRVPPLTEYELDTLGLVPESFLSVTHKPEEPQFTDIPNASSIVRRIFESLTSPNLPAVLIVCPSAARVSTASVLLTKYKPCSLQFHGSGRKQQQLGNMKKALGTARLVISTPSRALKMVQEGALDVKALELVVLDMLVDAKGLNVLSANDTREAVVKLVEELGEKAACKYLLY